MNIDATFAQRWVTHIESNEHKRMRHTNNGFLIDCIYSSWPLLWMHIFACLFQISNCMLNWNFFLAFISKNINWIVPLWNLKLGRVYLNFIIEFQQSWRNMQIFVHTFFPEYLKSKLNIQLQPRIVKIGLNIGGVKR